MKKKELKAVIRQLQAEKHGALMLVETWRNKAADRGRAMEVAYQERDQACSIRDNIVAQRNSLESENKRLKAQARDLSSQLQGLGYSAGMLPQDGEDSLTRDLQEAEERIRDLGNEYVEQRNKAYELEAQLKEANRDKAAVEHQLARVKNELEKTSLTRCFDWIKEKFPVLGHDQSTAADPEVVGQWAMIASGPDKGFLGQITQVNVPGPEYSRNTIRVTDPKTNSGYVIDPGRCVRVLFTTVPTKRPEEHTHGTRMDCEECGTP